MTESVKLITRPQFCKKLGDISGSTFWRYEKTDPDFPKSVRIGGTDFFIDQESDDYILQKAAQRGERK